MPWAVICLWAGETLIKCLKMQRGPRKMPGSYAFDVTCSHTPPMNANKVDPGRVRSCEMRFRDNVKDDRVCNR